MADIILTLVPADRFFMPSIDDSAAARRILMTAMPESSSDSEIDEMFFERVEYFPTGYELEETDCPVCGEPLSEEIDWWTDAMLAANATAFVDLSATTPCCHAPVNLADLPAAGCFARYGLSVTNPPEGFLSAELKSLLEQTLGSRLYAVYSDVSEEIEDA